MCCIFTCCGWLIDLFQRCITFTMSCVISSAICVALLFSMLSGVALGFNYSLAEYIDLKETNVSVYLKRGIFDDEISDDTGFRRSGHLPVDGHIGDENLITGAPAEENQPNALRSGSNRRLDQSIFESDDNRRFEGSLLKLTVGLSSSSTRPPEPEPDFRRSYHESPVNSIKETQADFLGGRMKPPEMDRGQLLPQGFEANLNGQNQDPNQSGRRQFMADYGSVEKAAVPYQSYAGRSGISNLVHPLSVYRREDLDEGVDSKLPPAAVVSVPTDKPAMPPIARMGLLTTRLDESKLTTHKVAKPFMTRILSKDYPVDDFNLDLPQNPVRPKTNTEYYIDDDMAKIPVRRKRKVNPKIVLRTSSEILDIITISHVVKLFKLTS